MFRALVCFAFFAILGLAQPASGAGSATAKSPAFSSEFGKTLPPIGFVKFCVENRADCQNTTRSAAKIELTANNWSLLQQINMQVNTAIRPVSDQDLYGVPELWTYPTDAGDCEDYLLLKKKYLQAVGFSANSLLITVVLDEKSEGHAILTVTTKNGDFVLDNRRNEILAWSETGYVFLKRQSRSNPLDWVSLRKSKDTSKTASVSQQ
jgi:predicted transglutaminase-like cysteine proteinase